MVWGYARPHPAGPSATPSGSETQIPGVQFRVLPGLGHTPMWDDPGLIAATIGDFAAAAARPAVAVR